MDSSDQRTRFHCLSVHQMTSGPENFGAQRTFLPFLCKINKCFPLCIIQLKLHFLMQWRTVLSDNYFPKYSHSHMSIMVAWRFLKQYRLKARWSRAFSRGFRPWPLCRFPLTLWIFSQYYKLWSMKDRNSLQSCAEKHCLWNDWQLSHEVWHKAVNHDPSLLAKIKP